MNKNEMILCDDGPTEDQEAEEITDIFKTQSENAKSPISDDLETQGEKIESLTTNVLEAKNENLKSPIRNALATQSKNVENLNNTPDTLSAQSDGGDDLPITVDILETQNESGKGFDKISDIPKTQSTPLEEGLVEKTDVSENQKTKVDNTKEIADSLKTQSECEDSSKEIPNILDIQRKLEKDWMEVAEISENVEISQSNDKESSKSVDVQSDNEDEMEISVAFEIQNENVEDPIDECIEIADETQNENVEDPIKITYILKAQKTFEQGSTELADIVEIQSDNDDGVLLISDDVEKVNQNSEHPHEKMDILEIQSEFRGGNSNSENLERTIERNTDNIETKSSNEDSSNESTVDLQKSTNSSIRSKDKNDVCGKRNKNDVKFKRFLIKEVRKQRSLYDPRSKGFAILDTKMKAWQNIATAMKKDVEICKQSWVDLRYNYQRYVRKLRKYLSSENINNKRRPVMAFERDLLFLWRYVADRSRCPMKQTLLRKNDITDINIQTVEDDDVVLVEDEPVLIINLEDNDDSDDDLKKQEKNKQRKNDCKITIELRKLVELLKEYPELYNIYHPCYNDYGRRGLIWSSFANELKDKATKLMKLWIYVQTRYEWELNSMKNERTELQDLLEFLKPYINVNPNTVYKQSFYLRSGWQEPIEAFKIIFQLLATLRKYPKLIDSTITKNTGQNFLIEYKRQWSEIGELRGFPPGQCENTWLIMRSFYWELINMRKNSYQLQDKWYFESIISELYMHTDQFKSKTPDPNNAVTDEVHGKSYAYSKPIPETQLTVKSFANLNALSETPKDSNLLEKQLKRKAVGPVPIKMIQVKKNVPSSSKQLSSNQLTNTNTTVLPRHTTPITFGAEIQPHATPITFETELPTKSSSAMVSIDITSSPPPSPSPSVPQLTPITAQNSTSTTNTQITTASDALSSNEILIELVASSAGNMLLINEATKKYSLNMTTTAKFIREIMAIPFLHNKELPPSAKHNHWVFIANRFQLPHHIAIACWDFLLENFQHFDQIAPMEQLMAPFPNFKVWKENTKPFQNFHTYAVKKGWFTYLKNLPVLMIEMAKYPELYDDALAKRNSSIPASILSKFPHIHASQISEICTAFKNAFVTYMKDLEQGIANKWPEQWWHVLEKLKFLVDVRYNKYEPFYYIIKNKIQEEIERNRELERLKAQQKAKAQQAANSGKDKVMSYQTKEIVESAKMALDCGRSDPELVKISIRECSKALRSLRDSQMRKAKTVEARQNVKSAIALVLSYRTQLKHSPPTTDSGLRNRKRDSWISIRVKWEDAQSAFSGKIRTAEIVNLAHKDPKSFLEDCSHVFQRKIKKALDGQVALKVNTVFCGEFHSPKGDEIALENKFMNSNNAPIYRDEDLGMWFKEHVQDEILKKLEEFQDRDSGWALSAIISLTVIINMSAPQLGPSYMPLPKEIDAKKACINVKNDDDASFAWAVISCLYSADSQHAQRMSSYPQYNEKLNMKGIQFPMVVEQIPRFEAQNDVSINVYSLIKGKNGYTVMPSCLTKEKKDQHVNLLMVQNVYVNEDNDDNEKDTNDEDDTEPIRYHYVWIKNLRRLVSSQAFKKKRQHILCDNCLHYFYSAAQLEAHAVDCSKLNNCKIRMPTEEEKLFSFKNYKNKISPPFVIYADLKCLLVNPSLKKKAYQKHLPYSAGYYVKCAYDPTLSFYKSYRGEDCIEWFVRELEQFAEDVEPVFLCPVPADMLSADQNREFDLVSTCHICEKPFTADNKKVRDHCNLTGTYRGPAHEGCNIDFEETHSIPVIFHNLSDYASHFIIKNIARDLKGRIDLQPMNKERYISFTKCLDEYIIKYRFMDSFQFMASSLDKLASTLEAFPNLKSQFSDKTEAQLNLLTRKGVFPYDYCGDVTRDDVSEKSLPDITKFYHRWIDCDISSRDYAHAQEVWSELNIANLGEYSDLYLKTDVLLLADVFEQFRSSCHKTYGLDPAHYFTLPGYTWDAMLKRADITLELLTDVDMLIFVERGIRGGLSQCSKRYTKANNKYMPDYDATQPSKHLAYFDINNQYGWAMSQYLPHSGFNWVEDLQNFKVEDVADDSDVGYILEVDLEYPNDLHYQHKDLPFCSEYVTPPGSKQKKILATLNDKKKYVIHYRALKQALKYGLKLNIIHRILEFKQSPWLKCYIDMNNDLSTVAENDFDKDLYKLMNNAVVGNTMKNIRKHSIVKLVMKWSGGYGAEALIAKPEFKASTTYCKDLVAVELNQTEMFFNHPIYVGMAILELAKTAIYDFHYGYMVPEFGHNFCSLCYMDTDSLIYEVTGHDLYEFIHVNKNIPVLMKDQHNGRVMTEFVGLRSKMYAIRVEGKDTAKKSKGVKRSIVKNRITFDDYLKCLNSGEELEVNQNLIPSEKQEINNIAQTKIALSSHDDKRFLVKDSYETLPWGHYSIMDVN